MIKKKSLGQHFLNSPKIISDIVSAGKVGANDVVVEIGPGEGTLTSALLKTGARIMAVEKDDRLIPFLQEKFENEISSGKLILIHTDILLCDVEKIIRGPYKLVANIPYYITGQIIRMFLESKNQPKLMTLLVQKEVAERIVAGNKKESLLSLSVKIYGEPKLVRAVGRGAFSPQPNVDSAVLNIENISRKKLEGVEDKKFFEMIHAGFAHKRKQLLPNLGDLYKKEDLISAFEKCGLDPKSRAEDVSLETWIKFCNTILR
ncbi:MAG TPA: ribosomal RNA small subunit methyltransferase A [Candidatus Zambryskibacteria bacterium]|nr:MAG: Ribosomal RNA small subunit methyltransferase A [Parcubacteria group bacterium GW2011_GWC1_39_12]KKR19450.1 MAG: Ribosomal RNA small subunit methyltransferase A [Parcubacteria group bacterium GW2011_GWF1_39_37]KKR35076.1 MAG: Ribosomal RNA small subunit methyltransferase A [Parcubacteria group bacterium GW2011_GWC2_40_10]KKR52399.1 MAG: Ribosomal RNA small subunit methyltransferase A [Parcubacteria group bacterium GW2011_GWE1_40_20]KKR65195.1 MAG: Ribosomal RNA small subunit methyltrans